MGGSFHSYVSLPEGIYLSIWVFLAINKTKYIHTLHCIILHYITVDYIPIIAVQYGTLQYSTLQYITLD